MKKKWILVFLVLSIAWFFTNVTFASGEEVLKAPDTEIIIKGEKKSAKFSHPVHMDLGIACGQCHHNSEHQPLTESEIAGLESAVQLQCAGCHNKDFSNPELQTIKDVFHARCKECHKQGVDGMTGPTKCTACHVKN